MNAQQDMAAYELELRELVMRDPDAILQVYADGLIESSLSYAQIARLGYPIRSKPLFGGLFGSGGFALASQWTTSKGLDDVRYFVIHADTGYVCGFGNSIQEALEHGRLFLEKIPKPLQCISFEKFRVALAAEVEKEEAKKKKQWEERRAAIASIPNVRSIPKRRQKIFDESGGKCHYCATALTLDGKWHIEHKMPKALMGGNEPGNLVASCVTCNHRKNDKTDLEFLAQLAKEAAA